MNCALGWPWNTQKTGHLHYCTAILYPSFSSYPWGPGIQTAPWSDMSTVPRIDRDKHEANPFRVWTHPHFHQFCKWDRPMVCQSVSGLPIKCWRFSKKYLPWKDERPVSWNNSFIVYLLPSKVLIPSMWRNPAKPLWCMKPYQKQDILPGPSKGCQLNPKGWRIDTF